MAASASGNASRRCMGRGGSARLFRAGGKGGLVCGRLGRFGGGGLRGEGRQGWGRGIGDEAVVGRDGKGRGSTHYGLDVVDHFRWRHLAVGFQQLSRVLRDVGRAGHVPGHVLRVAHIGAWFLGCGM